MSWLTNFVRPKLRALVHKKEIPDNLWTKCPSCEQLLFHRDLAENLQVCKHCGHHIRLGAKDRLKMLFDREQFTLINTPKVTQDPLKFKDLKKYTDRLKEARANTNLEDAILVAKGPIGGIPAVVAV